MLTKMRLLKMLAICSALADVGAIASQHNVTPSAPGTECADDSIPNFYYDYNKAAIGEKLEIK